MLNTVLSQYKTFCFACFACIIHFSSEFSLSDVCHKSDINCQQPNFDHSGRLHFERCQRSNILRRLSQISMLNCVKECIMTSQCRGFNYRYDWLICDLLGETKHIVSETGCIFSDIATWPKVMAGECRQHSCKNGERCIFNGQHQLCEKSYCIEAPVVQNAVSTERFGVYRNIGAGLRFKCEDGYKINGWPYSVCLPSVEWENKFSCVAEETGSCPDEWILHNEHCYFFAWEQMTWSQAKVNCIEKNSNLVKVEDDNEEMWIEGSMPDSKIWIGANDIENEGRWIWSSDSTTLQYFSWRSEQPDNHHGEEHCAHIFSDKEGGWNDIGCSERLFFTCERNAIL